MHNEAARAPLVDQVLWDAARRRYVVMRAERNRGCARRAASGTGDQAGIQVADWSSGTAGRDAVASPVRSRPKTVGQLTVPPAKQLLVDCGSLVDPRGW